MLKLMGKKIFTILCTQKIVYLDLLCSLFLLAHIVCGGFMLRVVLCVLCSLAGKLSWLLHTSWFACVLVSFSLDNIS